MCITEELADDVLDKLPPKSLICFRGSSRFINAIDIFYVLQYFYFRFKIIIIRPTRPLVGLQICPSRGSQVEKWRSCEVRRTKAGHAVGPRGRNLKV
jgi:hypothetical protein